MSDLVAIVYPTEAKAEEMRTKLFSLQKEYLIEIGDAVIAVKHDDGTVKLNQLINTTAAGALSGGFWGTLVGMIFLMPLLGAAVGAASGALEHFSIRLGVSRVREISVAFFFGNTFEKRGDCSPKLLNGARLHFA